MGIALHFPERLHYNILQSFSLHDIKRQPAMKNLISTALAIGFANAAIIKVSELVYRPEYRKYCEENLCGNYGKLPICPPTCGTSDEMYGKVLSYRNCLVLQTEFIPREKVIPEYLRGKRLHNELTEKLFTAADMKNILVMSSGPWKNFSCMSAYSIDSEAMAKACGMVCWGHDGIIRYFSCLLFN